MAECRDSRNNRNARRLAGSSLLPPDWTTLDITEPFLHPRTKDYHIAVETNYPNPGGDKLPERLEEAKLIGVKELLKIFNKVDNQKAINTLMAAAETPDYHVPDRPNPPGIVCFGLKVLVTVPKSVMDLVPYKEDEEEIFEPLPRADQEIILISNEVKGDIEATARIFENLNRTDARKISQVDLQTEATKLRKFVFTLERHLITNGYSIRREQQDLIIIGVDDRMRVLYVLIDDGNGLVRLSIRFDKFQNDDPINRPITIEYISRLNDILVLDGNPNSTTWTDLFSSFAFANPVIKPSLSAGVGAAGSISIDNIIDTFDTRSAKTEEEKEEEDRQLLSTDFKAQIFVNNKDASDFVGDVLLDDLEGALEKINSLEQVYQEVLDKFGMQCLIAFLIKCLSNAGVPDPCTLAKSVLRNADCGTFVGEYQKLTDSHPLRNPRTRDEFRRRAIECISRMPVGEREVIFAQLNAHAEVSIRVGGIQDIERVEVVPLAEVMGVLGDRIFEAACDATRNALVDSIPDDCFDSSLELLDTANGVELLCNFKIPTLNLPDFLPTFDIMGFITVQIETALLEALIAALVEVIKQIIRAILNCGDFSDVSFGEINLDDLISVDIDAGLGAGVGLGGVGEIRADIFANLSAGIGIGPNETPEERRQRASEMEDMMDALFTVLTPGEFSTLLDGKPTDETRKLIDCLLKKHQGLQSSLDNPAKIDSVFKSLGDMVNKGPLLRQIGISENANKPKLDEFCDVPYDDIRKELLSDKGLTPEEIDDQLDLARKRRADQLADLLNLLNKDNPLDGAIPPVFCKKDAEGNVVGGIIPRDPPSFQFMLDKVTDVIYDGVHMTFNQEISAFPASLQEPATTTTTTGQKRVRKKIKTRFVDQNGDEQEEEILNPEYSRLIAQGVSNDDSKPFDKDEDADDIIVDVKNVFESPNVKNYVAKGLRDALRNVEFNNSLFETGNRAARFIIPLGTDPLELQFGRNRLPPGSAFQAIFDRLQQAQIGSDTVTGYTVDYEMGTNANEDRYTFSIGKQFGDGRVERDFSFERVAAIKPEAQQLINQMALENVPGTAATEGKFAHFLAKVYSEGANIYKNGNATPSTKPSYARGLGDDQSTRTRIFSNTPGQFGGIRGNFKGQRYYELFRDYYAKFSREVSESPMFRSDVISRVDWLQVPLGADGLPTLTPGCNPHLLDLDRIKKQMKADYFASECEDQILPSSDGLGTNNLNPVEQSGISGAVQTFVRLYVIELILRSIFVFSEIKSSRDENIDDLISQYFALEAQRDLQQKFRTQDPEFYDDFAREAVVAYNTRVDRGEIEEPKAEPEDENRAISFFVDEQLTDVNEKIARMIGSRDVTVGETDYHQIMLEEWIPLFDVPENPGQDTEEARFGKVNPFFLFASNNIRRDAVRPNQEHVFNLENGNFILERYVRVVDRSESDAFNRARARRVTDQQQNAGRQPHIIQEVIDRPNYLKGVVKLEAWENFIKDKINKGLVLDHAFEDISIGLRLVYLPAVSRKAFHETLKGEEVFGDQRNEKQIFDEIMAQSNNTERERTLNKAFGVYEKFTAGPADFGVAFLNAADEVRRTVYPIPLVSVENDVDVAGYQQSFLSVSPGSSVTLGIWESVAMLLENRLRNTPEYSFLFKYAIPIDRMNTLAIIYCITYLSSLKKVRELFDGTKQQLKSVFQTLQNGGNYRYEDAYINGLNGNAGMMKAAQNATNTEPEVEGLSLAAMAARTPLLILKGLVELTDANIGRARKIVDSAKERGKNVPIIAASLLQLPMNVIPPPPVGPGIGIPITPLGFVYLALDIDTAFESAKGLNTSRTALAQEDFGLDLGLAGREIADQCNEED